MAERWARRASICHPVDRPHVARLCHPTELRNSITRKFQADLAIALGIVAPPFAHLDEQEQVHRRLDDGCNLAPRLGADRLDGLPALAQHDLALAFALHIDRLLDAHGAVLELLPL